MQGDGAQYAGMIFIIMLAVTIFFWDDVRRVWLDGLPDWLKPIRIVRASDEIPTGYGMVSFRRLKFQALIAWFPLNIPLRLAFRLYEQGVTCKRLTWLERHDLELERRLRAEIREEAYARARLEVEQSTARQIRGLRRDVETLLAEAAELV